MFGRQRYYRTAARRSTSSARTWPTPARTRSTTRWARRCWCKRMGKKRIVAETGAGQHGVATATAAALLGIECVVYMGTVDMARQAPNVFRMKLLGAEVRGGGQRQQDAQGRHQRGHPRLGDQRSATRTTCWARRWGRIPTRPSCATSRASSAARRGRRCWTRPAAGRAGCPTLSSPAWAAAATPSASSTLPGGRDVRLIGVEAGGHGIESGQHAARFADPRWPLGVLHGTKSYVMQDADGQIALTHSVSAGLDYASVGPEHAWLRDLGRAGVHLRHRRRGPGRLQAAVRAGGHHPRAGERPRGRRGRQARADRVSDR
jgi:tryptophan synthase beta chain